MSMTSAQIDELRRLADELDERYRYAENIATVLRDAANTIWQLRDDLQRTNDAVRDAEHDESRAWDRVRKAEAENAKLRSCLSDDAENARQIMGENAKLREQVAEACRQLGGAWARCAELMELARFIMHQCNDDNPRCDECIGWNDGECVALQQMRELGVEMEHE